MRKGVLPGGRNSTRGRRSNFPSKYMLADFYFARTNGLFFEMNERLLVHHRSQMSGNPVKIRDGCATVTATNSQGHCSAARNGKAGRRYEAEVRIPVWLCSSGKLRVEG